MSVPIYDLPNCPTVPLTIRPDRTFGWIVQRTHAVTGLPQVVTYNQSRTEAIREARSLTNQPE